MHNPTVEKKSRAKIIRWRKRRLEKNFDHPPLGLSLRHFGLMFGLLSGGSFFGLRFDDLPRLLQQLNALLASCQFLRDVQRLLGLLHIGLLGAGRQFLNFQLEARDQFPGALVADGGVFAGIGLDLRAVHADRAHAREPELPLRRLFINEISFFLCL